MLDVLLINPNNRLDNYNNLGDEFAAYEPPAWCLMLAGYLQNKGKTVEILDANLEGLNALETASQALSKSAKVVAIVVYGQNPSASTQLMPGVIALSKSINNLRRYYEDTKTVAIGGHIAALPQQSMEETNTDYICFGEGFAALDSLVENTNLQDLVTRHDDVYLPYPSAPLIVDLSKEIPRLPWELLDMTRYKAHNWHTFGYNNRTPYAALYTTLGCPFNCEFCCIQAPFKSGERALDMHSNSYRNFSVEWVLQQFEELHKLNITHVKIIDELFVFDVKRIEQICDGLIDKGYNFNIWAYARLNILDESLLAKMKLAGFNWIGVGIESADKNVRNKSNKQIKQKDIYEGAKKIKDAGIALGANFIFGLPEDDLETMQATLDMAIDLNAEWVNFSMFMPFPGSKLYTKFVEMNNVNLPKSWEGYSYYSKESSPMNTRYISGEEVRIFRDAAFISYLDRQEYKDVLFNKYGQCAVDEIDNMLSLKINR